jgi:hypothetical protein
MPVGPLPVELDGFRIENAPMRDRAGALCVLCSCIIQLQAQSRPAVTRRTTPEVWHPRLEHFTPAGSIQTEFGSALSEGGYRKLMAAVAWRTYPSERADYYFDAYDGHEFLLRTGVMPLKVRIKLKKQEPQWQVSRFVAKDRVLVGAISVKVHTTESWEGRLARRDAAPLIAASDDFVARLDSGGVPLREAADRVEAAWQALRARRPPPGLVVIDRTLAGHAYHFYPRKVTPAKARLSAALPGFSAPAVTLMLGTEPEVDAEGHSIFTYELEAEADGPVTAAQARAIALAIGRLMQRAGMTPQDQLEVLSSSNEYTLRQLARQESVVR